MYFPGTDMLSKDDLGNLTNLGLVTNNAALSADGIATRISLLKRGYNIIRLFSPEHGLDAQQADGAAIADNRDAATGLPVISLYGQAMKPDARLLADLDAVLFDIPDVGCRFYTYLWTMTFVMEACAEAGIPFYMLDRPNPIGGDLAKAEGPMLDEINCSSFIGRWRLPLRHSCTFGELALFFQKTRLPGLKLEVIPCDNWDRAWSFFQTGSLFVPTSPAICDAETALLYPGTGLLEGIQISEGRGTDIPFKQAGAPWINSTKWKEAVAGEDLNGVKLTEVNFTPQWGMYIGEKCSGLRFHVMDAHCFKPVEFGLQLLYGLFDCFPELVHPRLYTTAANPSGCGHLDKLTGIQNSFQMFKSGKPFSTDVSDWAKTMEDFLIY